MTDGFLVAMEPVKKKKKRAKLFKAPVKSLNLLHDSDLEETIWTESRQLTLTGYCSEGMLQHKNIHTASFILQQRN